MAYYASGVPDSMASLSYHPQPWAPSDSVAIVPYFGTGVAAYITVGPPLPPGQSIYCLYETDATSGQPIKREASAVFFADSFALAEGIAYGLNMLPCLSPIRGWAFENASVGGGMLVPVTQTSAPPAVSTIVGANAPGITYPYNRPRRTFTAYGIVGTLSKDPAPIAPSPEPPTWGIAGSPDEGGERDIIQTGTGDVSEGIEAITALAGDGADYILIKRSNIWIDEYVVAARVLGNLYIENIEEND